MCRVWTTIAQCSQGIIFLLSYQQQKILSFITIVPDFFFFVPATSLYHRKKLKQPTKKRCIMHNKNYSSRGSTKFVFLLGAFKRQSASEWISFDLD